MSYYYPGYTEAREAVQKMTLPELLNHIDALFGRDNLEYGATEQDVREEALRQTKREFTDTSSPEYETVQFYVKLHQAARRA